jgi:probable phosphoglycerate mutase
MRPLVILCRHGNTFNKGDKVVMVGAREDLPLTARGIEQATEVGKALAIAGVSPSRIVSGPLRRTKVFAEILQAETKAAASIEIDNRLCEFDYGAWSGLSNEEIVALSGKDALEAWQERSVRPSGVTFVPSQDQAREEARALLRDLESDSGPAVIVTSNGRLRELGLLLSTTPQSFKVGTGHACIVDRDGGAWRILGWDLGAEKLIETLKNTDYLS